MLDKLLTLLLQSKGAAVSLVFVIGSTTALVNATTHDGATSVTIANDSNAAVTAHARDRAAAAPADQTVGADDEDQNENDEDEDSAGDDDKSAPNDNTASAGTGCSDQAKANGAAVRLVDSTFVRDQLALIEAARNKGANARQILETALPTLRQERQNAVKAIHDASTCAKSEGDDEDANDMDENDEDDGAKTATTGATVVTSSADVNAVAALAVQSMTATFNEAKAKIDALPAVRTPTRTSANTGRSTERASGSSRDKEGERD
jgi:hypothetical protein